MSVKNRNWRESIGVVAKKKKKGPARKRAGAREVVDPMITAPVSVEEQEPPAEPRKGPAPPIDKRQARKLAAQRAALAPVALLLDSLPVGSLDLARQVAEKLWPDPDPEEIRAVSVLATRRNEVTDDSAQQAILRTIVARQKMAALLDHCRDDLQDPARLQDRVGEWSRLADVVEQISSQLRAQSEGAEDVVDAACSLLPPPERVRQQAALCSAVSGLVESIQTFAEGTGGATEDGNPLALSVIPEAAQLLARMQAGSLLPEDQPFLELTASLLLAHQDIAKQDRDDLERARALLGAQGEILEDEITRAMSAHVRDPERTAVLAAWRRRLLEMRARVDECLTSPAASRDLAPRPAPTEKAVLEHFAEVRKECGEVEAPKRTGWRRWLPISL